MRTIIYITCICNCFAFSTVPEEGWYGPAEILFNSILRFIGFASFSFLILAPFLFPLFSSLAKIFLLRFPREWLKRQNVIEPRGLNQDAVYSFTAPWLNFVKPASCVGNRRSLHTGS